MERPAWPMVLRQLMLAVELARQVTVLVAKLALQTAERQALCLREVRFYRLLASGGVSAGLSVTVAVAKLSLPTVDRQALCLRGAVVQRLLVLAWVSSGLEATVLVAKLDLVAKLALKTAEREAV
eukprot:contig_5135_g1142